MAVVEIPKDKVFITPGLLRLRYGDTISPNLYAKWQKEGKLVKIRNGLYIQPDFKMRGDLDRFLIANRLYEPSYVSLFSALRYYNFIPESVYEVTSLSTRKTKSFQFKDTDYSFRKLKASLFFGFNTVEWRGETFRIASPAKAILDLAYMEPLFADVNWLEELRLDAEEMDELIDWDDFFLYAYNIGSRTLNLKIAKFLKVYYP